MTFKCWGSTVVVNFSLRFHLTRFLDCDDKVLTVCYPTKDIFLARKKTTNIEPLDWFRGFFPHFKQIYYFLQWQKGRNDISWDPENCGKTSPNSCKIILSLLSINSNNKGKDDLKHMPEEFLSESFKWIVFKMDFFKQEYGILH